MILSVVKKICSSWSKRHKREKEIKRQYKVLIERTIELSENLKQIEIQESERIKNEKSKYTFISVFPTEEIMERAFDTVQDVQS